MTIIIQTPVQTHKVLQKAMFRNQNYNTGQLRYFDNNLSRTPKKLEYMSFPVANEPSFALCF